MTATPLEKILHRLKVKNFQHKSVVLNGVRKHLKAATFYELLDLVAQGEKTNFSPEESALYDSVSKSVGRGELSIRKKLGLSQTCPGTKLNVDIPEMGREVKEACVGGAIKPGDSSATFWANMKDKLIYDDAEGLVAVDQENPKKFLLNKVPSEILQTLSASKTLDDKTSSLSWAEVINIGVSKNLLNAMPESVSRYVMNMLTPSRFLKYPGIYFVWQGGYIDIPNDEFDEAWEPIGVSQQKPRVRLRRSYLENRAYKMYESLIEAGEIKMKKIALIAASCKPFHVGHYNLIKLAARENDHVMLYVSLSDRARPGEVKIKGKTMERLWRSYFEQIMPKNVVIEYTSASTSPVRRVYEFLGKENEAGSDDTYRIYGLSDSLENYPHTSLEKYADRLYLSGRLYVEPVPKTDNVSGTMMRQFLADGNKDAFIELLPPTGHNEEIWSLFLNDGVEIVPVKVFKKKKR